jgi:thiol-disulfide isomerase/thioredoxin
LTCVFAAHAFSQSNLKAGSIAPAFTGTLVGGDTVSLAGLRGKVVVITFWTTRCPICQHEMPILDRVIGQYDPKDVVFLALTTENEHQVKAYLRQPFTLRSCAYFGTLLRYADRDGRAISTSVIRRSLLLTDRDSLSTARAAITRSLR